MNSMSAAITSASRAWSDNRAGSVETLQLRDGMVLMLSAVADDTSHEFHYEERDDVFGIGFHLMGGARFELGEERFTTGPMDVWAGASPKGARSKFTLPQTGFRTVSLRFKPDAASDLLETYDVASATLREMTRFAGERVSTARLVSLNAQTAGIVHGMFATPYTHGARTLFLESCMLGVLAAQFDALSGCGDLGLSARKASELRLIHRAREILDQDLSDPPSIASLARSVGVNDFKLKRSFKEVFGTTIFGYVRQRRMQRAAADLHAGMQVAEAAAAVGYECPRCFADAFRRHFGVLPSEVTRRALSKLPLASG
jgi:AraC family transcriptional regulator, transcriptional activator of the genes for pyochelin and ferripyochelin receptors